MIQQNVSHSCGRETLHNRSGSETVTDTGMGQPSGRKKEVKKEFRIRSHMVPVRGELSVRGKEKG